MIRIFKFDHNDEHRVWATADTHFCHNKEFLYKKRGYDNIEDHDRTIIENWNNLVRPQDSVIHLGDFVLGAGKDSKKKCEEILAQLNGTIYMLWGNHLAGLKQMFREVNGDKEVYPTQINNIVFIGNVALLHVNGLYIFCSHYAHRIWPDMNKGVVHLCGHSHGSDIESNALWPYHKRLDVGIEQFDGPISFDEIKTIMDSKKIVNLDHHNEETNRSF